MTYHELEDFTTKNTDNKNMGIKLHGTWVGIGLKLNSNGPG